MESNLGRIKISWFSDVERKYCLKKWIKLFFPEKSERESDPEWIRGSRNPLPHIQTESYNL